MPLLLAGRTGSSPVSCSVLRLRYAPAGEPSIHSITVHVKLRLVSSYRTIGWVRFWLLAREPLNTSCLKNVFVLFNPANDMRLHTLQYGVQFVRAGRALY